MNIDKQRYFENIGDDFYNFMDRYDVLQRKKLIFDNLLHGHNIENKLILEVGSGTGEFSLEIINRGGILIIFDIGLKLVSGNVARNNCLGVAGDACNLPFDDSVFDFVISSECIEHTLDPILSINEMCRVIKPFGIVCLTTPNRLWYPILLASQLLGIRKFSGIENWIFPQDAKKVMRNRNMCNIHLAGCHLWPFQISFSRLLLCKLDTLGKWLYPLMINFGIIARKNNS